MLGAQAALAAERDGARRKRLTAFRQHRRLARLIFDRLRRMRVTIARRSRVMVRNRHRAWGDSVFGTHRVRPSRTQVEERCREKQRDKTTRSHDFWSEISGTSSLPLHRRGPEHRTPRIGQGMTG